MYRSNSIYSRGYNHLWLTVLLGICNPCLAPALAQETVKVNNLAYLEAGLNILANGSEVLLISTGIGLFVTGIALLFFRGKRGIATAFLLVPWILITIGLAVPGIINWGVASYRESGNTDFTPFVILAIVGNLVLLALTFFLYFLPSFVSYKRRKLKLKKTILLNFFLAWLSPVWIWLLVLSFLDDKAVAE